MEKVFDSKANALPGQPTEEVGAWIKAHPTLRPNMGNASWYKRAIQQPSDSAFKPPF
jgi:hypothetical protein